MDGLHFVLADLSGALIEEWRHAFKQHVPDEIRGHIQVLRWQTLPRPTINSSALNLQPTAVWTVGVSELHISLFSLR